MRKSVAAVIAASAAISGCGQIHAENGGPTVSRTYQGGNFQQIEVPGPYDVEGRTRAHPRLSARGSRKLLLRTPAEVNRHKPLTHPQHGPPWVPFAWPS